MSTAAVAPALTVAVVPLVGGAALATCLARLASAQVPLLIAVGHGGGADDDLARTAREHGALPVVAGSASVPARRQRCIEVASTEIVALLEDTTLPDPGWCDAVRAAFADPGVGGVGGPVRVSTALPGRLQALGWSEYGVFHPDLYPRLAVAPAGPDGTVPVARLPGNNLAFRRTAVLDVLGRSDGGLIEAAAGDALRARGLALVLHPGMAATYVRADRRGGSLRTRFHHGRIYGGGSFAGRPWPARLGSAAKAAALPLTLSWRTLGRMRRVIPPAVLLRLAPWVGLLETAWAVGEGVGCLAGQGQSLARWR